MEGERSLRDALVDFLLGVLDLNPDTRWTPRQALQHPFITGGIFHVRPCCPGRASQPRIPLVPWGGPGVD